jgi:hypothetical protein
MRVWMSYITGYSASNCPALREITVQKSVFSPIKVSDNIFLSYESYLTKNQLVLLAHPPKKEEVKMTHPQ